MENRSNNAADVAKAQLFSGLARQAFDSAKVALRANAGDGQALLVLATIACEHENYQQAQQLLALGETVDAPSAWHYALKGRCQLAVSALADARKTARLAAESQVSEPEIADMVGVLLSRAGLHSIALSYFERAVKDHPEHPNFLYNFATALQFSGRLEEAAIQYERLLALAPGHHRARLALVQLYPQTESNNRLAELQAQFETGEPSADEKLLIGHAIAKTLEDLKQWDESFDWLERAKSEKAENSSFTRENNDVLFRSASDMRHAAFNPCDAVTDAPIFVVGMPRSGTTLVERILGNHSHVQSAGELADFGIALKRVSGTSGPYVLEPATLTAATTADLSKVASQYLEGARQITPDSPRFIDKMPFNFFYAPAILAAFPNAHIICLRRDPADTVLSNFRQLFATGFSYYDYSYRLEDTAAVVAHFNRLADAQNEVLPKKRYHHIAYEEIVRDQDKMTRELLAFCELPFEEACLTPEKNAQPVATASSVQVRQPVYSSSIDRWKRYTDAGPRVLEALSNNGLKRN